MEFKVRKVTKGNGGVDFRIHLSLSEDEAKNAPRIADWDETNLDFHRTQGDVGQRADWVLMQARLLAYWSDIWNNRDRHKALITQGLIKRESPPPARKKKRRKR